VSTNTIGLIISLTVFLGVVALMLIREHRYYKRIEDEGTAADANSGQEGTTTLTIRLARRDE
jgi:hypothetical protein